MIARYVQHTIQIQLSKCMFMCVDKTRGCAARTCGSARFCCRSDRNFDPFQFLAHNILHNCSSNFLILPAGDSAQLDEDFGI